MEYSVERQTRVLELADEFMKAGRYAVRNRDHGTWSALADASSRLTGAIAILLAIVGICAMVARGCLTERNSL